MYKLSKNNITHGGKGNITTAETISDMLHTMDQYIWLSQIENCIEQYFGSDNDLYIFWKSIGQHWDYEMDLIMRDLVWNFSANLKFNYPNSIVGEEMFIIHLLLDWKRQGKSGRKAFLKLLADKRKDIPDMLRDRHNLG